MADLAAGSISHFPCLPVRRGLAERFGWRMSFVGAGAVTLLFAGWCA